MLHVADIRRIGQTNGLMCLLKMGSTGSSAACCRSVLGVLSTGTVTGTLGSYGSISGTTVCLYQHALPAEMLLKALHGRRCIGFANKGII